MSILRVDQLSPTDDSVTFNVKDLMSTESLISASQVELSGSERTVADWATDYINFKNAGAAGDGTTDDSAILAQIVSDYAGKKVIIDIPPGIYTWSSVTDIDLGDTTRIKIRGAGSNQVTINVTGSDQEFLNVTGNTGNWWVDTQSPHGSFDISGVSIACNGGSDDTGTCMYISIGTTSGRPSKACALEDVVILSESGYFAVQVDFKNTAGMSVKKCRFFSGNGVQEGFGIRAGCDDGSDGAGLFIDDTEFLYFAYGVYTSDHFEGIYCVNSAYINCNYGFATVATSESGVLISNCEFDCFNEGIHLAGMYDFVITGNCFLAMGTSTTGITVINGNGFTITGNKISGPGTSAGIGINLQNTNASLNRTGYVGGNSIDSHNIAMQITGCNNLTFGDFTWYNCTVDTVTSGTNTNIQQAGYKKTYNFTSTLSSSTSSWTVTLDISDMKLTRKPYFASLVPCSGTKMCATYNYDSSSATSAVFVVTLGDGTSISAATYRFAAQINSPFFQ